MKKLKIEAEKCIGCGTCVALCPKTFFLNEEGKAEVKNPPGETQAQIQDAIDSCPTQAIIWGE